MWDAAFETLASLGPPERGTCHQFHYRRAHQHAAGAVRGAASRPKSTSAPTPLTFDVTRNARRGTRSHRLRHEVDPDRLLGDKGYDCDEIRDDLTDRGIEPVIPPRSNRKATIEYDREAYKRRNLTSDASTASSNSVASQPKTARAYLSMLRIASAILWIKTVNTTWNGFRTTHTSNLNTHQNSAAGATTTYPSASEC